MKKLLSVILILGVFSCKKKEPTPEPIPEPEPVKKTVNLNWATTSAKNFTLYVNNIATSNKMQDSNIVFTVGDIVRLRNEPWVNPDPDPSSKNITQVIIRRTSNNQTYFLFDTLTSKGQVYVDKSFKVVE